MIGGLFFLSVLGFAMLAMLALPKLKAGAALLCAICGMLFVSYYGAIVAGWMVPVAYALMYGGLACFAGGAAAAAADVRGLRKRLLCPAMAFFAVFSLVMYWDACTNLIQDHDSYSYWARAAKELFTFDRFYVHMDATMFHMDYIPLQASLQYCITRVFGWQEPYLRYVTAVCVGASIAAMVDLVPRSWFALVLSVLLYYAYRAFGFHPLDMRGDSAMLAVFAAALISLLARQDDEPVSFLPAVFVCAVLPGFKIYSGLMFAVIVVAAMILECPGLRRRGLPWRRVGALGLAAAVLVAAFQLSWSVLYNASTVAMYAQDSAARAAYIGQSYTPAETSVSIARLLSGNPRTGQLMQSFTDENIQQFLQLAGQTLQGYVSSNLMSLWLFVAAAVILCVFTAPEKRRAFLRTLTFMLLAALIYLLGLFASYFVQAETAGAAVSYLKTASAPLLMAAVFFTFLMAQGRLRLPAGAVLGVMTAGMMLLVPPAELLPDTQPEAYGDYASHVIDFFEYELDGQITEADAGKRALLIDCSYGATTLRSQSGKTHTYAYYTLPLRLTEPIYYVYGDYTQLDEGIDGDWLRQELINRRCELLILRIEDELYWEEIAYALDMDSYSDSPVGVYDVDYEDGAFTFTFRGAEAFEE